MKEKENIKRDIRDATLLTDEEADNMVGVILMYQKAERTKVLEELREWADRLLTNWALSAEKPERIVLIENFKKEFLTEIKGEKEDRS